MPAQLGCLGGAGSAEQAAADSGDASLQLGMAGLQLSDCKENIVGEGAAALGTSCRLACAEGAAAALRPLGDARAEALGAACEADEAAEAALAAGGGGDAQELPQQDSFEVWGDGSTSGDSCSLPRMGSPNLQPCGSPVAAAAAQAAEEAAAGFLTPPPAAAAPGLAGQEVAPVDPFSPGFQRRMLGCLEPAVAEVGGAGCEGAALLASFSPAAARMP